MINALHARADDIKRSGKREVPTISEKIKKHYWQGFALSRRS